MATVTIGSYLGVNMDGLNVSNLANATSYTYDGTHATYYLPGNDVVTFYGSVTYDAYGWPHGTITGMTETVNGQLGYSVEGLSTDAYTAFYYAYYGQDSSFKSLLFGQTDTFIGGPFNDVLRLYGGDDWASGGGGGDLISASIGDDTLSGDDGNDALYGEDGADILYGGAGANYLYGGNGADMLFSEGHGDVLYGQGGGDLFVVEGSALIQDFKGSKGDRIEDLGRTYSVAQGSNSRETAVTFSDGAELTIAKVAPSAFSTAWIV